MRFVILIFTIELICVNLFAAKLNDEIEKKKLETEKSKINAEMLLQSAINKKNDAEIATAYQNLGFFYYQNSDYVFSLNYFQKALAKNIALNNEKGSAISLNNIGLIYETWGKYAQSLKYYSAALKIMESIYYEKGIAATNGNIAKLYYNWNNRAKALEYLKKELAINEKLGNIESIASCLNNIGIIYLENKEYKNALLYYNRILELQKKSSNKQGYTAALHNIGNIYLQLKDFIKSKQYLEEALAISKKDGNKNQESVTLANLCDLYYQQNNFVKSLEYLKNSQIIAQELNIKSQLIENYHFFAKIYEKIGNYELSLKNYKNYKKLSDSVFSEESQNQLADFQIKYETANKEKEIRLLKKEKDIQNLAINKQFYAMLFLVSISILLIILVILVLSRYKIKYRTGKALEKTNAKLIESNEMKDKILSLLAHDLKTPIAAFYGITDLMNNKYDEIEDVKKRKFIFQLSTSAKSLIEMLDNILQWAIIKQDTSSIKYENINIKDLIEKVMLILSIQAEKKQISIVLDIEENTNIYADKNRIMVVLMNLVSNSNKFTNPNGIVKIIAKNEGLNKIKINVIDNGVGMDDEVLNNLFKVNTRYTSLGTANEKGTGLGLIICKEFIEQCGGTLNIESKIGEGTNIEIILPSA